MTASLKPLSIILLQVLLIHCKPQSYNQELFLQRISPYSDNSIYAGSTYDTNEYRNLPASRRELNDRNVIFATNQFDQGFRSISQQPSQDSEIQGCGQSPAFCQKSRYQTYDGSCNNLRNPGQGIPQTRYNRLLPAKYGDGISTPTTALSGNPLPSARLLSVSIYPDIPLEDPVFTLSAMQYGQIITHDMSMVVGSTQTQPHSTRCCSPDGQLLELANSPDHCYPITVPVDDPVFSQQNIRCMNFVRTITDRDRRCVSGNTPAEQLTAVNHYLDLSIVYGNSDQINQQVRSFQGGKLRTEQRNGQDWLPRNQNVSAACTVLSANEPCYMAADTRANQNPQLTILQTLLLREHNRLADKLGQLNPHWDDEIIFQEARKINIAQHQYISYYEWLPIFIGLDNALKNRIIYRTNTWVNDYDSKVNPTILNEHATAAFRFFHSLIAGQLDLVSEERNSYGNVRLSDWFNRPAILEQGNSFDELTRGMATQPELASDAFHSREITLNWLREPGQQTGQDLKAICIQRNRDHGLASYNDYRHFCGLPKASTFSDFTDVISRNNVERLAALYEHPDDVDLTVGGSLESLVPGTLAGPTFLCILTEQFYRTRVGDRFWFENSGEQGFTLPQLNEIRKSSIARIMCDNSLNVRAMQPKAFERISSSNAVVSCEGLPQVDLTLWKDLRQTESHLSIAYGPEQFVKK